MERDERRSDKVCNLIYLQDIFNAILILMERGSYVFLNFTCPFPGFNQGGRAVLSY
jgi:hypothetical protein